MVEDRPRKRRKCRAASTPCCTKSLSHHLSTAQTPVLVGSCSGRSGVRRPEAEVDLRRGGVAQFSRSPWTPGLARVDSIELSRLLRSTAAVVSRDSCPAERAYLPKKLFLMIVISVDDPVPCTPYEIVPICKWSAISSTHMMFTRPIGGALSTSRHQG